MTTMQRVSKNGKAIRNICTLLMRTGQGVRMAANTGYRAGYFMARHPEIEIAGKQLQKNYKPGLVAITGIALGIIAFLMMKK